MNPAAVVGGVAVVAGIGATVFTLSFRRRFGPVQDRIRRFNRDVTNPRQLRTAGRPGAHASVVHHVGRRSGTAYRTPVVAMPHADGFVFALPYGPGADWVRNVMAAGTARVEHEGGSYDVAAPALLGIEEANPLFGAAEQRMHRVFGVRDFLRVHRVSG